MEEENIEIIDSELNDSYSNDDLYNITSWGADLSFREIISMYEENELLKPELQRKYVWEKAEASRFIESILLGLPVPSIFLANTSDEKKLIIDGYQRRMTVFDYVKKGIWSKDNKTFKLSNTGKINERWRGKAFSELSEFDHATLHHKTRLVFLSNHTTEEREPKQNTFTHKAQADLVRRHFSTIEELKSSIYSALVNYLIENGKIQTGPFDATINPTASLEDLDANKIVDFVRTARSKRGFPI